METRNFSGKIRNVEALLGVHGKDELWLLISLGFCEDFKENET